MHSAPMCAHREVRGPETAHLRLEAELRRWREAGRRARLWWRDDDAREPSAALERVLALSGRRRAPLALAVVPDRAPERLAPLLVGAGRVSVLQHGIDHCNRRRGLRAAEFPGAWPLGELNGRLRESWSRLEHLPGACTVFVPAWNDVHPQLPVALKLTGYAGLSAFGSLERAGPVSRLDCHLSLLRWSDGARFRGEAHMHHGLAAALRARRKAERWDVPIGLLTHHLDHDAAAWAFLDEFLSWSAERPELTWMRVEDLLPRQAGRVRPPVVVA